MTQKILLTKFHSTNFTQKMSLLFFGVQSYLVTIVTTVTTVPNVTTVTTVTTITTVTTVTTVSYIGRKLAFITL